MNSKFLWLRLLARNLFTSTSLAKQILPVFFFALNIFASYGFQSFAGIVTFGLGDNQFNMEFVTIGDPGNTNDTTGAPNLAGRVDYTYGIGKFEVSEEMIAKFNESQPLQITKSNRGMNKPVTNVSWNEAARFVNWLNTSSGGFPVYKFIGNNVNEDLVQWSSDDVLDYDSNNRFRSKRAIFALPNFNEWYKAAYYDPRKIGGPGYWDYPTGSDVAPSSVASGVLPGTAVYGRPFSVGPADVNQAGGLSPYGVMGLGGNVQEWEESSFNPANILGSAFRGVRGGNWDLTHDEMLSINRGTASPREETNVLIGFRVAQLANLAPVPEPTSMAIFGLGVLGMAYRARRKAKA